MKSGRQGLRIEQRGRLAIDLHLLAYLHAAKKVQSCENTNATATTCSAMEGLTDVSSLLHKTTRPFQLKIWLKLNREEAFGKVELVS